LRPSRNRSLQGVGVLVFVDQHVLEMLTHVACELRDFHEFAPVEQQVVVVEHLLVLLEASARSLKR
jgi:hypothetical protein